MWIHTTFEIIKTTALVYFTIIHVINKLASSQLTNNFCDFVLNLLKQKLNNDMKKSHN